MTNPVQPPRRLPHHLVRRLMPLGLLCLIALPASAQLYKIIGPDGKISYSDTPPSTKGAKVERKNVNSGSSDANLPFEVADAARNHPVTLYTAANCAPCDEGRNLLKQRGIPFAEKTISSNDDQLKLKQVTGELTVPSLTVGRNKLHGFEAGSWQAALNQANYPESNKLPSNYAWRAPEPAAPPPPAKPAPTPSPAPVAEERKPPPPQENNAHPGFRF